ncbi:hypothetical protein KJS94_08985 [Flavihumibacter rivuli]|uniref:hypothetical protein n=1 Tax=Flavihumibacter rivuli TaxID=2838156 RepID=UPI001BDF6A4F|nr:hypothetical protein [Flavihumibacter rivuli]ULQ58328.1 hypothetical protein KJS94_08985 [Flavihumibacter rivuli]
MPLVQLSNRCKLFESIAANTWNKIIRNHHTGNQAREIGLTSDIVSEIEDNRLSFPNIGVWAVEARNERTHGNDMDIFVETTTGQFLWWALQAKVLNLDGTYHDIATFRSGGEYQWTKLNRLLAASGCVVRYLLYNGSANYHYYGNDICIRNFNEDQFGCSLVKATDVERLALAGPVSFHDFHPELAQPWRIITCCLFDTKKEKATYYSAAQVREAVGIYPNSFGNTTILDSANDNSKPNDFSVNAINDFSSSAERIPAYRIVIRSTTSINLGY